MGRIALINKPKCSEAHLNLKYLGQTNIKVSSLGLGTVKFGRNQGVRYPQPFDLPSDHELSKLLSTAKDLGINLLDTAPAYGISEERLGKLLKGQRKDWIICTKVGEEFSNGFSQYDFSPEHIKTSILRSLKRLNTDVIDIVLVHSNGDDQKIILEDGVFATLAVLKNEGLIRSYGMSTKTVEGGYLAIDYSDVVMVTYNETYTDEQAVIEYAGQKSRGVFIKKALASGHLSSVENAMEFVFNQPAISSVILGTINVDHLKQNVECVAALEKLHPSNRED